MKYLNLSSGSAQDPLAIRASDAELGVWFRLQCYCHQQMNGGSIQNCKDWTDDMWMRAAGIRASSVAEESPMWHYNPMGWLIIHLYDQASEDAYRKKRRMGREYVMRRWQAEREKKIIRMENTGKSGNQQK